MGWWQTPEGDALGDGPADVVIQELSELQASLGRALRPGELLAALTRVLSVKGNDVLQPGAVVAALAATLDFDGVVSTVEAERTVCDVARDRIDAMCARIADEYEMAFDRRPSLREMLGSIRFALGGCADDRLDIIEGTRVRDIFARS